MDERVLGEGSVKAFFSHDGGELEVYQKEEIINRVNPLEGQEGLDSDPEISLKGTGRHFFPERRKR